MFTAFSDHAPPCAVLLGTYPPDEEFHLYSQRPIFLRSTRKKSGFNKKCLLEWNMKNTGKAGKLTFTVQPDAVCQVSHVSPQDITSHIIHRVISHTRGASNVWMLADDCVVQTKASFLRLAMWYHKVPWGHCCPSACFTLKLITLLHQHLEALLTERD